MLVAILLCLTVGLLAPRFGTRENVAIGGIVTAMVLVYLLLPARFM